MVRSAVSLSRTPFSAGAANQFDKQASPVVGSGDVGESREIMQSVGRI